MESSGPGLLLHLFQLACGSYKIRETFFTPKSLRYLETTTAVSCKPNQCHHLFIHLHMFQNNFDNRIPFYVLLTSINLNPIMDNQLHPLWSVGWTGFFIPKLQRHKRTFWRMWLLIHGHQRRSQYPYLETHTPTASSSSDVRELRNGDVTEYTKGLMISWNPPLT